MATHLESLLFEYLDWQGYLVRRNIKVGRLSHGGWEMELDIVGYKPSTNELVHYEPSIDAQSWKTREERYLKKFESGRKHILKAVFPWLSPETSIKQIAVFVNHPKNRHRIAGGEIMSVDQLVSQIREKILEQGVVSRNAIPEQYPMLRTLQLSHCGYFKPL